MTAPERIWACVGKRGGNRYWVGPGEIYQSAHELGPYVRADIHAAALDEIARLRADKAGLQAQIGKLLVQIDDDFTEANGPEALTMHTYGQTPDWYVEAAFWACFGYAPNDPRAALAPAPTGQEGT